MDRLNRLRNIAETQICPYCEAKVDCSIYKEYGTGHSESCMLKDCWLDEDFARWSDFHIIAPCYEYEENCHQCSKPLSDACKCHLQKEAKP